jgi:hypothetical protein
MKTITYNPYDKRKREFEYETTESQWSSNYYGRPLIKRYDLVSLSEHMIDKDELDKESYMNLMSSVNKANKRDISKKSKDIYVIHLILDVKTIKNELWLEIACEVEGSNALIPARWISGLWWTDNLKERKNKCTGETGLTLAYTSISSLHSSVWIDDYWKDQYVRPADGRLAVRGFESNILFTYENSPINGWMDHYE